MNYLSQLFRLSVHIDHLDEIVRIASVLDKYADEGDDAKPSGGGGGKPSGKFIQFMKEEGDKKLRNPDTGNNVKLKSLNGPKGKEVVKKLFMKWLDAQKDHEKPKAKPDVKEEPKEKAKSKEEKPKGETPSEKAPAKSKFPTPELKKDRYKDKLRTESYIGLGVKPIPGKNPTPKTQKVIEALTKLTGKKLTEETIADLLGTSVLAGSALAKGDPYGLVISNSTDGLRLKMQGPHITNMERYIRVDDNGDPYIYNDTLYLNENSPKGLGTKIFATEVAQAKAAGIKSIQCSAFRDRSRSEWVGYKVWPKLGYDGPLPIEDEYVDEMGSKMDPLSPDIEEKLKKAGFKKPYMVSHLYQIDGGQEYWEKNGEAFHATFDLSDDSMSMKVLSAYLEEKAKKENTTAEDWMSKVSSRVRGQAMYMAMLDDYADFKMGAKKPKEDDKDTKEKDKKDHAKGKKYHEQINLDKNDHDILDKVWKKFRK